ncbi:hypothetical protein GCM10022205_51050 [Spinactinospora alkalitolerans]
MPWVNLVRDLGPSAVVLAIGLVLVLALRPRRRALITGGLVLQALAAALPFLWLAVQVGTGFATESVAGLVMLLAQPAVAAAGWLALLLAAVRNGRDAGARAASAAVDSPAAGASAEAAPTSGTAHR